MKGTLIPTTPATRSGCEQRELPDDHRAPVVTDEHGPLLADVVEQREQVAGQVEDVVVLDAPRAGSIGRSPRWSGATAR